MVDEIFEPADMDWRGLGVIPASGLAIRKKYEEFDAEKKWWKNRVENDFAWKVSMEEIKKRGYNLDIKNPKDQIQEEFESSEKILNRISKSNKVVDGLLLKIKEILN